MKVRVRTLWIDPASRQAMGRFALKLAFCLVFGALSKGPFLQASSGWLLLNAGIGAASAIARRVRMRRDVLTEWDEAFFLAGAAGIFFILHRLI